MSSLAQLSWIFVGGAERTGSYVYALMPSDVELPNRIAIGELDFGFKRVELAGWFVACSHLEFAEDTTDGAAVGLFDLVSDRLKQSGAVAVWFGDETSTWNPSVLDPGGSAGNVVAASLISSPLITNSAGGKFDYLNEGSLRTIWAQLIATGIPSNLGREDYAAAESMLKPGKDPDFLVEGRPFDSYGPTSPTLEGVRNGIIVKIDEKQIDRIVVNLQLTSVTFAELRVSFATRPVPGLTELIVIDQDGNIEHIIGVED